MGILDEILFVPPFLGCVLGGRDASPGLRCVRCVFGGGFRLHTPDFLAELNQSILQKAFAGELMANPDKALAEAGL